MSVELSRLQAPPALFERAVVAFLAVLALLAFGLAGCGRRVPAVVAEQGDPEAIRFPRPMHADGLDFSFSGLKTAVANVLRPLGDGPYADALVNDVCASFQAAVVETLVARSLAAVRQVGAQALNLGGGVSCNSLLRNRLSDACAAMGVPLRIPSPRLCADNAAMIAWVGARRLARGERAGEDLDAFASLEASGLTAGAPAAR